MTTITYTLRWGMCGEKAKPLWNFADILEYPIHTETHKMFYLQHEYVCAFFILLLRWDDAYEAKFHFLCKSLLHFVWLGAWVYHNVNNVNGIFPQFDWEKNTRHKRAYHTVYCLQHYMLHRHISMHINLNVANVCVVKFTWKLTFWFRPHHLIALTKLHWYHFALLEVRHGICVCPKMFGNWFS